MVPVGQKQVTERRATAKTRMYLGEEILGKLQNDDIQSKKGPVFQTAIIAGTMAVKKTHELIPFCHPLLLEGIKIQIEVLDSAHIEISCSVSLHGKTGVEMEALQGATQAALTIYDMCKALSHNMVIEKVALYEKTGGKSDYKRED